MMRGGSDIGGTFTDVIVFEPTTQEIRLAKVPTTRNLSEAVLNGIAATGQRVADLEMLVHGSTVVINALLERKGVPTALVTTAGFRDVYEIGRINRPDSFNVFFKKHEPLVPREWRFEIVERMLPDRVLTAPTDADIAALVATLAKVPVSSVAICLLHAYANPAHEITLKAALSLGLPGRFITVSHELTREYREYERTSTVVANAYVGPIVDRYLSDLSAELIRRSFVGDFHLMQSNGGLVGAREARRDCISLIESGPAGGVIGTQQVLADVGVASGVAFDMGGTTAKAGVVEDGVPRVAHQYFIGPYATGLPVLTPVMDIHEVGTGGGSIAVVTEFGELRVGPRSAGAEPGPASYGHGGQEATVTDANVVLGRLHPGLPLAGSLTLDAGAAREAIAARVAKPLGVSIEEAAAGIVRVANTAMAFAISAVTIERGLNPADFVLIAYGGAGPLHATHIARELAMRRVVVPPNPGVFSAYGMLFADPQGYASRTRITRLTEDTLRTLDKIVDEMIKEATARLTRTPNAQDRIDLFADMRYVGQEHTVTVPLERDLVRHGRADEIKARFDAVHERTYAHSAAREPAEIVTLRCSVTMASTKPSFVPLTRRSGSAAPRFLAPVWLSGAAATEIPFYARDELAAEQVIRGPAVVFENTTSTLLVHGDTARVHRHGHLLIDIEE